MFSHHALFSSRRVQGQTCIIEPLLQQRLQFAHVLKAQIQGLKARDGRLAEVVPVQFPHGQANIPLITNADEEIKQKSLDFTTCECFIIICTMNLCVQSQVKKNQSETHLCKTQFDTPLFESLCKLFQFLQITRLLQSWGVQPFGW